MPLGRQSMAMYLSALSRATVPQYTFLLSLQEDPYPLKAARLFEKFPHKAQLRRDLFPRMQIRIIFE